MLIIETSPMSCEKMIDIFADLSKEERVKLAIYKVTKEGGLSIKKAIKIY